MNISTVGIVVLYWNDSEKTIRCIESIFKQKKIKFNLILVDNNSKKIFSEKIINWLKKNKIKINYINSEKKIFYNNFVNKSCYYIKNKKNYGCGLGHNPGYKYCLDKGYKYIARIDNDMYLPDNLIYKLSSRLEKNKNIIALSPKVMFYDKPNLIWFRGAKIGFNLKLQRQCSNYKTGHSDSKLFTGLEETDAIVGCASIMRSKHLKQIGLSDPEFFYGEEDIELSHRLSKMRGKLYVDLNEKIFHSVSHTVGKNWAKNVYYNYKYRLLLVKKIGTFWDKFFGYSVPIIKLFISIILSFDKKNSSLILQRYYGLKHFYQKKYGDFDRKNYLKINYFFSSINKQTNFLNLIKHILNKKFI